MSERRPIYVGIADRFTAMQGGTFFTVANPVTV